MVFKPNFCGIKFETYQIILNLILDDYANTRVEIDNDYDPIPVEEHIINENKRRSKGRIRDFRVRLG